MEEEGLQALMLHLRETSPLNAVSGGLNVILMVKQLSIVD